MSCAFTNGTAALLKPHVLIIGAGISGLVLAQSLKKHSISCTIYERDPSVTHRGRGWGLTIHWSLDAFLSLLPQNLIDRLPSVYVDPDASDRGENGNFLFFDLQNGEARWKVPPAKRIRVSRERLRALLMDGLDIKWSKAFAKFTTTPDSNTITAHFSDSTTETGHILLGGDGIHSRVRAHLIPVPFSKTNSLPVRLLGATVTYGAPLAHKIRSIDPFFFQGGDPASDAFLWHSFLDTPSSYRLREAPKETDVYECQIIVSWPFRPGWRGNPKPVEAPESFSERMKFMKDVASGWAEPFREMVMSLPEDEGRVELKAIKLEDWVPKRGLWDNEQGKVTLMGDAAHAMTMFRGEGANHAIMDVAVLMQHLLPVLTTVNWDPYQAQAQAQASTTPTQSSLKKAIDAYEEEMMQRTAPAVLTSRRACLDAHEYKRIDDQSPLVSRRVMITEE